LSQSSCPLLGPVLPPNPQLHQSLAVSKAKENLPQLLQKTLANLSYSATTSFSVAVFSGFDNQSLVDYHFAAPKLNNTLTSGSLNRNTVYRVGSVTKLTVAYTLLVHSGFGILQEPITKFIPELAEADKINANDLDRVEWSEITVESLLSHSSGITRDYGSPDLSSLLNATQAKAAGLPALDKAEVPSCGIGLPIACSREQYFRSLVNVHPITAPYNTPVYSNTAFALLGFVIQNVTGLSLENALRTILAQPLGLNSTSYQHPSSSPNAIVIPPVGGLDYWSADLGFANTAGGLFSTTADMTKLGQSILRSSLLSPRDTRKWMKPHTHTSTVWASVGAPWEILRMEVPLSNTTNQTRVLDLYTKSGDLSTYSSMLILDVDHNVGFSVMAAGSSPSTMVRIISDIIAEAFIPAFEEAARENAAKEYVGTYATGSGSNITLALDDRPGLGIKSWFSNGTSVLASISALKRIDSKQTLSLRLYPTKLSTATEIGFRATIESFPKAPKRGIINSNCQSWLMLEVGLLYGGVVLDDIVIQVDVSGRGVGVQPRAFRETLRR
ncbi:beta-lactamase/transpeptidase-like protein, partial [Tothia fuscella]